MSKVSVIIPVYNNEKYIEKCIRSVMEQTYQNLEIIVIDDGSTDGSYRILEKLKQKDKRITVIHQENAGVAAARNKGLDIAAGDYLTFVDGDDYISDDYIEKLYQCARRYDAEMVICGLAFVSEKGEILQKTVPGEYKRFEKEEWTFRISAVCSHFYCRKLWEEYHIRFYAGERGEDMPISLFFSAVCEKIVTLQECGYFYVQHMASAMHNFKGLKNYSLPYCALEESIKKVQTIGIKNSRDNYELFVLRILCTCLFQLARGASAEKIRELCDYIERILKTYFPEYNKNRKTRLFSDIEVPFSQKTAVWLLVYLVRMRILYPAARLICL